MSFSQFLPLMIQKKMFFFTLVDSKAFWIFRFPSAECYNGAVCASPQTLSEESPSAPKSAASAAPGAFPPVPCLPLGVGPGWGERVSFSDGNVQEWNWAKETEEGLPQKLDFHYLACPCIHMSIVSNFSQFLPSCFKKYLVPQHFIILWFILHQ